MLGDEEAWHDPHDDLAGSRGLEPGSHLTHPLPKTGRVRLGDDLAFDLKPIVNLRKDRHPQGSDRENGEDADHGDELDKVGFGQDGRDPKGQGDCQDRLTETWMAAEVRRTGQPMRSA